MCGPICQYCGSKTEKTSGQELYPHSPQKVRSSIYWICKSCNAWVGCHPNTDKPLGTVANTELRRLRSKCHAEFDILHRGCTAIWSRTEAYKNLAKEMGISNKACHFSMFNIEMCEKSLTAIKRIRGY